MIIEYTTNRDEVCVAWEDENGVGHSMLKSAYDAQQAQAEQFTPIVVDEAETI